MPAVRRSLAVLAAAALVTAAAAPSALARRPIKLKVPRFVVPPGADREVCTFVRLPMRKQLDLSGSLIVNVGVNEHFVSHHFLIWAYAGSDLSAFPARGVIVDSKACLDFGPADTNQRVLIAGSQTPRLQTRLPTGLALPIKPAVGSAGQPEGIGLILNSHWINGSDQPQRASVRVKLVSAKRRTVRRFLQPIFDVVANGFIKVPPGQVKTESWGWSPGARDYGGGLGGGTIPSGPACVVSLTSHMHKRGKLFTVDFIDRATGHQQRLFANQEYSDPPQVAFNPPMLVSPGQTLQYTCTHDNGVTTAQKLGCEEQAGVTPGVDAATVFLSGRGTTGAARRCSTDADCAGFGTGRCVPANLVFGYTSDDDMCILPGSYYPANVGVAAGHECDLAGLPILN